MYFSLLILIQSQFLLFCAHCGGLCPTILKYFHGTNILSPFWIESNETLGFLSHHLDIYQVSSIRAKTAILKLLC